MAENGVTKDELVRIATRMAQELQEYIDEADEFGWKAKATQALLEEWEVIYSRLGLSWKNPPVSDDDEPTVLDLL